MVAIFVGDNGSSDGGLVRLTDLVCEGSMIYKIINGLLRSFFFIIDIHTL